MTKFKEGKQVFSVGDLVKLVNIDGLYSSQNHGDNVRLELGETYPVVEVDGDLIRVMKSNGEIEGCYPYRVELVAEEQTAESLKQTIFPIRQEREQTIVWRNDFDNILLPFEYNRHFESEACIARLSTGKYVAGNFSRLKGLPEVSFHAVGIAFYGTECIKEFAFLE